MRVRCAPNTTREATPVVDSSGVGDLPEVGGHLELGFGVLLDVVHGDAFGHFDQRQPAPVHVEHRLRFVGKVSSQSRAHTAPS